jgi:hypothetical protein
LSADEFASTPSSLKLKSINHGHYRGYTTLIGAVPSVGNMCTGVTASTAPTWAIYDSPVFKERIYFGSLTFVLHLLASCLAFNSFREGIDLALGDLRFHINTLGTLHLPDLIHSTPGEPTSPSSVVAPTSPSSVGSSNESESTRTSIIGVDCDTYHTIGLNNLVKDRGGGSTDYKSCSSGVYPTCFQCEVIDPITEIDDGDPEMAIWNTVSIPLEACAKA